MPDREGIELVNREIPVPQQELLTELFAHVTVLQSHTVALLRLLEQEAACRNDIRDCGIKLHDRARELMQLTRKLTGVGPTLIVRESRYHEKTGDSVGHASEST